MSTLIARPNVRNVTPFTRLVLFTTLFMLFAACSSDGRIDGPVFTSPRPPLFGGFGYDAQVGGTLEFNEKSGCLLLSGNPVVWPAGASWQSTPAAVKLQGHTIEPGMVVLGSGGYHQHGTIERLSGTSVANAARACTGPTGEIAQFNLGSDVEIMAAQGIIDGPVLTSPKPPSTGYRTQKMAQVKGSLVFDKTTGCLFLAHEHGGRYPVIWPAGTAWQTDPLGVNIDGQIIEPGMSVLGAGGYLQHSLIEASSGSSVADAARACTGPTGEIAQFNLGSDVEVLGSK